MERVVCMCKCLDMQIGKGSIECIVSDVTQDVAQAEYVIKEVRGMRIVTDKRGELLAAGCGISIKYRDNE